MYGLKNSDNVIVDVASSEPIVSEEGILFNNCLYPPILELEIVEDVPDYVVPQRFTVNGSIFTPIMENMSEYENLLITTAQDELMLELINGGLI